MKLPRHHQRGFTLIELMITVAIVGILSAIAVPSYNKYVLRANRANAKTALLSIAQRLEQNYTLTGRYDQNQAGVAINNAMITTWGMDQVPLGGVARYTLTFAAGQPALGPPPTFVLIATPVNAQATDTCGNLQIDNRNLKGANGQGNRNQITIDCWDK